MRPARAPLSMDRVSDAADLLLRWPLPRPPGVVSVSTQLLAGTLDQESKGLPGFWPGLRLEQEFLARLARGIWPALQLWQVAAWEPRSIGPVWAQPLGVLPPCELSCRWRCRKRCLMGLSLDWAGSLAQFPQQCQQRHRWWGLIRMPRARARATMHLRGNPPAAHTGGNFSGHNRRAGTP